MWQIPIIIRSAYSSLIYTGFAIFTTTKDYFRNIQRLCLVRLSWGNKWYEFLCGFFFFSSFPYGSFSLPLFCCHMLLCWYDGPLGKVNLKCQVTVQSKDPFLISSQRCWTTAKELGVLSQEYCRFDKTGRTRGLAFPLKKPPKFWEVLWVASTEVWDERLFCVIVLTWCCIGFHV